MIYETIPILGSNVELNLIEQKGFESNKKFQNSRQIIQIRFIT